MSLLPLVLSGLAAVAAAAPQPISTSLLSTSCESWQSTGHSHSYISPSTSIPSSATSPAPSSTTAATTTNEYACATVSSLVASATDAVPKIPAQLAWDCLQSVPLNATASIPWVQSLIPYIHWQTTTAYLKNPPAGYLEPAVDVYGTVDDIISNLETGVYSNEYELEYELYHLFQSTHDGHFRYLPTLVAGVLTFGRPLALVSVSSDGRSLPKPYVYSDILLSMADSSFTASGITSINGEDAIAYLENWSQYGSLQDPDALYNNVFYELAQVSLGNTGSGPGTFAGSGRGAYIFPNATTVLTFENGTTTLYENFARVLQTFDGIQTGQDVYDRYLALLPEPSSSAASSSTAASSTVVAASTATPTSTPAPGYPAPIIRQENNLIGGYYLDGADYEDVAVLSVPSFVSLASAEESFQQVALDFISQSKVDGKTKLVIDVSANGGGTILQGYSLFKNLFPDMMPYGATRFRAHQAFNIMGEEVSAIAGPVYPWNITTDPNNLDNFLGVPFDYRADVDINYENFDSWAEKYGPHEYYGDYFTSLIRWNLSDPTSILTSGITVNGYQNRTNIVPVQPYAADDIIILYDGYCASTCTIFSELMTAQGGVKTIAVGGRPFYGITQAVGGVKGTNDYGWDEIWYLVNSTYELGTPEQQAAWDSTELAEYSLLPFDRSFDGSGYVNARDGIQQDDETQTPLQFVYQAADCRIFYTAEMTVDVTALWKTVVDTTWGGKSSCVAGDVAVTKKHGKAARNVKKHARRTMDSMEMAALEASQDRWTDLRGEIVIGDGFMLP